MRGSGLVSAAALVLTLSGCGGGGGGGNNPSGLPPANTSIPVPASVQPADGSAFGITVFAQAPGTLRPDDMVQLGKSIFVVYQDNNNNPDGTNVPGTTPQSVVIEYDLSGNVLQTFNVPGHPDGLVVVNANTVWVSTNEDANPEIIAIDTTANTTQTYTADVPQLPHGGGLDDMKLINGVVYASASNPTLTASPNPNLSPYSTDGNGATAQFGVNTGPVVYSIALNSDGKTFHSTPGLLSSTPATLMPGNSPVTLNTTDADSSAIDPKGNLVIDSQQDSELIFISNVGTVNQMVTVLLMTLYGNPWPLDDTRWSPASGVSFMLLSDNSGQLIYRIDAPNGSFVPNTAFSAGQGTVLQSNTTTGAMTPIYVGMKSPHGMIFVTP